MEIEETKKGAYRHNEGKPEWSLVDFKSLEPLVNVLMYGCQKYDRHNWKKGLAITSVLDSLYRHINAFQSGETNDKESGLPHIGHAMANLMFIQHHLDTFPELDDRGKDTQDPEFQFDAKEDGRADYDWWKAYAESLEKENAELELTNYHQGEALKIQDMELQKLKEISEVVSPDETETSITNCTYPDMDWMRITYLLKSAGVNQT